jgi:6-phosphogluconate dehydrogenase
MQPGMIGLGLMGSNMALCLQREGHWTKQAAVDVSIPATVISAAMFSRFSSRGENEFTNKLLSAMRDDFDEQHEK